MPTIPPMTPVGVRDYPPEVADAFYALQATITGTFEEAGYRKVMTPAFELAAVFERGLGPDEAERVMRFVDPQNGEMLVLRSDITPQIARLAAGPLRDAPLPLRLCYFGRVFRLRQHSEFQRREVAQAGVELIGIDGPEADIEVLTLCDRALHAAGSGPSFLSIGHVGVVNAALAGLGDDADVGIITALLRRKDATGLRNYLDSCATPVPHRRAVEALPGLYGRPDMVLDRARSLSPDVPGMDAALDRLEQVLAGLKAAGLHGEALLDLGEVLGLGYYTGIVFHAYVQGIGQSVASGGRYDGLMARFGRDLPAAGFALDEEGLTEARQRNGGAP